MLQVRNIDKYYSKPGGHTQPVLRDASLEVPAGRIVALFGSNGSGKTTLLKVIAGLVAPDRGAVSREHASAPVGMVHQRYRESLFPWRTVRANLALAFESSARREASGGASWPFVDKMLDELGIGRLAQMRPATLSGGEAQMVAIARALVDPTARVLLLDEPFTALDGANLPRVANIVATLARERQASALLVTHDIDTGLLLADTVALLGRTEPQSVIDTFPSPSRGVFDLDVLREPAFLECKRRVLEALFSRT